MTQIIHSCILTEWHLESLSFLPRALSLQLIIVFVFLTGKQSKKKPRTWDVDSPVEQNQMRWSTECEEKQRLCSVKKQLYVEEHLLE